MGPRTGGYQVPRRHLDKLFAGIIGFVLAVLGNSLSLPGTPREAQQDQTAAIGERLAVVETEVKNLTVAVRDLAETVRQDDAKQRGKK